MTDFGKTIKQARRAKGLSQSEVAQELSVTQTTISAWETGKQDPQKKLFPRISELLEIRPEDLVRAVGPRRGRTRSHEKSSRGRFVIAKPDRELEQEFYEALAAMVSTMRPKVADKREIRAWVREIVKLWSLAVFQQERPPSPAGVKPFPQGTKLVCNLCDLEVEPTPQRGCDDCGLHCGWNPALDSGEQE